MSSDIYRSREDEIIDGCRRKDRKAQRQLYDLYASRLYPICLRYLKDPMEAEDVLVTSFTRILEKIGQFKGEGSFEGWMKKIVIRQALMSIRKNQLLRFEETTAAFDQTASSWNSEDALQTEDLLRMINEMPAGYRTVFNLYAIDGYSHKEIAQQLNISENTSKSQLSRARNHLQQVLNKQNLYQFRN